MRVLVTGGAGFIGSHIVAEALKLGLEVAVLDNFSSGKRENVPAGVAVHEVDLRDRAGTARVVAEVRPDVVSHQAAQVSVPASMKDPVFDAEVNIIGGLNLLQACATAGVTRFVFASSGGATYGEVPEGSRADESYPTLPKSPYGISKLAFEQLLGVCAGAMQTTILRYANVYGPRQEPHGEAGVVALFFDAALSGQTLRVFARRSAGDDGCVRDYVYVRDVARANLQALTGFLPHSLLNVASGRPTTTLELARQIIELSGSSSDIARGGVRAGDIECSLLDPSRFEQTLGATTPLSQGLAETARYYRER